MGGAWCRSPHQSWWGVLFGVMRGWSGRAHWSLLGTPRTSKVIRVQLGGRRGGEGVV